MTWKPISTVPTDGRHVLLFTTCHGVVEAWFAPGEWMDCFDAPGGREYNGAVWVCADDAFQIEIEETPTQLLHGTATHWMQLPEDPPGLPTRDTGPKSE